MRADLVPHPESDAIDGITYDRFGRMQYHPEFHPNHGQPFTEEDLMYLCVFYGFDDVRSIGFAIGKTEHVCRTKYTILKKLGLVEHYKAMYQKMMAGE